jgi:uncharacterized protein (DUF58 family)
MWFKDIFRRPTRPTRSQDEPLFDERFLRRLERLSVQTQRTLRGHPARGEHLSRHLLPSSIFSDHRPYTHGDDLRYVDWNAYARQDVMLLKLGEAEQDIDVHLLLDVSRSMAWGEPPKLRVMQQLAGALGYLSLSHSDRVYITPFGDTTITPFGPAQGKGRVMEMLRYLENITIQQQTHLRDTLTTYAHRHQRGGMLILCSDLLTQAGLSEGLEKLKPPRWQVMVLHIIDRREVQPDFDGSIELLDSETGQSMPVTFESHVVQAYHQQVHAWLEQMAMVCARRGANYARIFTDMPLERKVVPYLRSRRFLV